MRSFSQASTKGKRVVGKRGRKKILMAFKGEEQHKVVALGCSSSNSSQDLYKGEDFVRPKLDGVFSPTISTDVRNWLEREFEEEELALALEDCRGDKAPGLYGFNLTFIKAGWQFLKKDFADMLSEFRRRSRINREKIVTFFISHP
ncbi:hypothetical protein MRB53_011086 [Persea americana]|uniref:Uncharacterized protein n=1 Tax=Persea americana TaxID=3435 RepID=A0ACC2LTS5_PERAE|nr:hypothetical protein MRB53_011086 [Persea americana]